MDTVLKLIMLKLGVLGVVKVVSAIIFVGLAAKTLIFMTKMTFLKSIFLPFLAIPLLVQFMMNNVTQSGDDMMEEKPQETSTNPNIMNMISSEGRRLSVDDPISATWESVKSFAESEQCIERISCLLGASNNDSAAGNFFFE